jgi:hypothetical protein
MSSQARGAATKTKNQEMAQRMKALGIRRTTGLCPLCYRNVAIPMDRHFYGAICK